MNYKIALLGIIEIVSALSIGVFILALTYRLLVRLGRKVYDVKENNTAYGIFIAAIMFSAGYMVSSVIQPLISSFRLMSQTEPASWLVLKYFGHGLLYITIAYGVSITIGLLSTALYSRITPLDEWKEIRENNIGIALIMGAIVIVLTLLSKSGVGLLIESIIPYPDMPPR